jgi:hypothetical protein
MARYAAARAASATTRSPVRILPIVFDIGEPWKNAGGWLEVRAVFVWFGGEGVELQKRFQSAKLCHQK